MLPFRNKHTPKFIITPISQTIIWIECSVVYDVSSQGLFPESTDLVQIIASRVFERMQKDPKLRKYKNFETMEIGRITGKSMKRKTLL